MALEVRLRDAARLTKDIDLGLRENPVDTVTLHDRLIEALGTDQAGDGFVITPGPPAPLREDGGGHLTWRVPISARLADKPFGGTHLDVSPRPHELDLTDRMAMPNSLDFAGIPTTVVEIVDIHRHAAEKLHAMCREFGDRKNTRVRDLIDLVILIDHDLLDPARAAVVVSKLNGWEGAIAVVDACFGDYCVSSEYPTFKVDERQLLPPFFGGNARSPWFWETLDSATKGSMVRRRRINIASFLCTHIWLPPLDEQARAAEEPHLIDHSSRIRRVIRSQIEAVLPAALNEAFAGLS